MSKNIKKILTVGILLSIMNSSIIPAFATETTGNLKVSGSLISTGNTVSTGNNSNAAQNGQTIAEKKFLH